MSNSRTPQRKKADARRRQSPGKRDVILDRGTGEAAQRRRELIGSHHDQTLASEPIGILLARGHLGAHRQTAECRLAAGRHFADLRRFVFGAMSPSKTVLARAIAGAGSHCASPPSANIDARDRRMREAYEQALLALRGISRDALAETIHLCHWTLVPDWSNRLLAAIPTLADLRAQENLLAGLDALASCFGIGPGSFPTQSASGNLDRLVGIG
jgi:hypothetical protein